MSVPRPVAAPIERAGPFPPLALHFRDRAVSVVTSLARELEARPGVVFALLTVLYVLLLVPIAGRPLWHDELFTFYIVHAPNFRRFVEEVQRVDLNPPLVYAVTFLANRFIGESPAATRIPEMLAFYGACWILFGYLRRKIGTLYGAFAILVFWSCNLYFRFAAEARPYALLILFFSVLLASYDRAVSETRRGWAIAGVATGAAGMCLSHVFALFSIAPFFLAELVRLYRRRKPDVPVGLALILPLVPVAIYMPLVKSFHTIAFPAAYQAGLHKILGFFSISVKGMFGILLGGFVAALAVSSSREQSKQSGWQLTDGAIAAGLFAMPVIINLLMMRSHGAFWDRYCLTTAIALYCGIAAFLAWRFRGAELPAFAACAALFIILLGVGFWQPFAASRRMPKTAAALESIRPDLPLVCASGVTFLEMDHLESPAFKKRLYLLQDRPLALQYAHATLFEGFFNLKRYFPIQANVVPFADFVRDHHEFLVLGRIDHPEDWLLPKLAHDGAMIQYRGEFPIPYVDRTLYQIRLSDTGPASVGGSSNPGFHRPE